MSQKIPQARLSESSLCYVQPVRDRRSIFQTVGVTSRKAYSMFFFALNTDSNATDRFKYALFVSMDANFKLKRKINKSAHDVSLSDGTSSFVESELYRLHLASYTDEAEVFIVLSVF
jgi:hypothetical protein